MFNCARNSVIANDFASCANTIKGIAELINKL